MNIMNVIKGSGSWRYRETPVVGLNYHTSSLDSSLFTGRGYGAVMVFSVNEDRGCGYGANHWGTREGVAAKICSLSQPPFYFLQREKT